MNFISAVNIISNFYYLYFQEVANTTQALKRNIKPNMK